MLSASARRWPALSVSSHHVKLGESVSQLDTSEVPAEHLLVLGKIENLRVALRSLHGVVVPPNRILSFWMQLGAPVARRGFVPGRELREGCIIPSIGGGLCQLSNALYQAALQAGLEIIERHGHSQIVPGSAAEVGQDATVFWNYVDLRLRSAHGFRIEADMDQQSLRLRIMGFAAHDVQAQPPVNLALVRRFAVAPTTSVRSCGECGETACFRRATVPIATPRKVTMVDGVWPEFDSWQLASAQPGDRLFAPVDGVARGRPRYAWHTGAGTLIKTFPWLALWRGFASRRLATEGAVRQASAGRFRARLAAAYAAALHYTDEHLVVTQELLPYLWERGVLQGRSFDVMMTSLPLAQLQSVLDEAARRHPDSPTLADFRAPVRLAEMEQAALRRARLIVTPHAQVAALFRQAQRLPWSVPPAQVWRPGNRIIFPASTLARKGACELREVARQMKLPLTLLGPVLESTGFWDGIAVETLAWRAHWLDGAAVVVLPAWLEQRPQALLEALAAGVPVICTPACGLAPQPNLTLIEAGDSAALYQALLPFAAPASQPPAAHAQR
jgi:hypothetical protein